MTAVKDAKSPLVITVTKADSAGGSKKDPNKCALAKACIREKHADGAIINIGVSYIIKGKVATRYLTSAAVGREITSFDRHHDFAAGKNYRLAAVSPGRELGVRPRGGVNPKPKGGKLPTTVLRHRTTRIRTIKS